MNQIAPPHLTTPRECLLVKGLARWLQVLATSAACGMLAAPTMTGAAEPVSPSSTQRQIRPFTPTPSKSANQLTANITPSGKVLPPQTVDPGTLVINPGEDTRVVAGNPQMLLCREPACLDSLPLAFEDVPLERLGKRTAGVAQPVVSAAKFFGVVPLNVPRTPKQRCVETQLGTTDPRYVGAVTPPGPYYISATEQAAQQNANTARPFMAQQQTPADDATHLSANEKREKPFGDVTQVAANEPIPGLQQALPGFTYVDAQGNPVQPVVVRRVPVGSVPQVVEHVTVAPVQRQMVVQRVVRQPEAQAAEVGREDVVTLVPAPVTAQSAVPQATSVITHLPRTAPVAEAAPQVTEPQRIFVQPARPYTETRVAQVVEAPRPVQVAEAPRTVQVVEQPRSPAERIYVVGQLPQHYLAANHAADPPPALPVPLGPRTPDPRQTPPPAAEQSFFDHGCNFDAEPSACTGSMIEGECGTACCDCSPYCSVETLFFAPLLNSPQITANAFDVVGAWNFATPADGLSYVGASPRITIGMGCYGGRGLRARYWQMNNSYFNTDPLSFANPNDFTAFTAFGQFKAYTFDLEATHEFCFCRRTILGSIGARYAGLSTAESLYAQVRTRPVPDLLTAQATSQTQFYGTGLTFGLQCIEPLWKNCCGDWDLFVSGRGSALFGPYDSAVASSAQVGGAGIFAVSNNLAQADNSATLLIGELQAGLQWSQCVKCCGMRRFFGRCAFEYQYWGVTNPLITDTTSFAGRNPVDQITITANRRNLSNVNLIGLSLSAGCYW